MKIFNSIITVLFITQAFVLNTGKSVAQISLNPEFSSFEMKLQSQDESGQESVTILSSGYYQFHNERNTGIPMTVIILESLEIYDNEMPKSTLVMLIPTAEVKAHTKIKVYDDWDIEGLEKGGAVCKFFQNGEHGKSENTYWSNIKAGSDHEIGEIEIYDLTDKRISGKFHFKAWADEKSLNEEEVVEIQNGVFDLALKTP